ncbi:MAG: FtsQ-type POTRA domain-containing protein [Pseudomonadota bacterium]|nr:FtsQ-type POTRA domain-containing protein [Pseudomonadota bacterium]
MKSRIKFLIIITGIIYLFFNYKNLIGPYPIKEVKLKGEFIYVDENKLRKDLNLFIGKDLMTINLIEIKKNVEQNDWIKNSLIMREFPDILAIELFEYKPLLLWNEKFYIDDKGEKFEVKSKIDITLPSIRSSKSSSKEIYDLYTDISDLLKEIGLSVQTISHAGDMLQVDTNRYKLLVRYSNYPEKFNEFISIYEQFSILAKKNIKVIDLRYSTGFAVH